MPLWRTSAAIEDPNSVRNALVEPYMDANGLGIWPAGEEVKAMKPLLFASMSLLRKWCVMRIAHVELHSWIARCCSTGRSANIEVLMKPALLNTRLMWMSDVAFAIVSMYPSLAKFAPTTLISRSEYFLASSSLVAFRVGSSNATNTTSIPCLRSFSAIAFPIPLEAPVTRPHFASYFFFKSCGYQNSALTKKGMKKVRREIDA
mmetsp:Transcript_53268/g.125903  ORF Transcript_53268/g.125903 Transcript_53268/m.125903 type:complete len:204 (-) Transcript_53268:37-648(-)